MITLPRNHQSADRLFRAIMGTTLALGVIHLVLFFTWGSGPVLFETPWYIPMMHSFTGLAAFCVAYLALGRYRVLRDPAAYWIGLCFAAFAILSVFFILTWPGLLPNGQAVIARLPGTSAWIAVLELTDVSALLMAAVLSRWPGERALQGHRWLGSVLACLGAVILLAFLLVALEAYLPSLVAPAGRLGSLLLTFDWGFLLLLSVGAILSTRRYRQTGDKLLGYVALTQVSLVFVVLTALIGAKRYDLWYYLSRILLAGGFVTMLFGLLSEYVGLFRREQDKTLALEAANEELRVTNDELAKEIAERQRVEEAVRRLNRDLEQQSADLQTANRHLEQALVQSQAARSELEATNKELEAFTYSVSHDLRAPLHMMREFSQAVLQDQGPQLPADSERLVRLIHQNAVATIRLVEDLLALARTSQLSPQKQAVNTREIARQVWEEARRAENGRLIEIQWGDLPTAHADPVLLKQVWTNLISNALKFTRHRERTRVEIGSLQSDREPVFYIRDNGAGFDNTQSERLFRAFQRLHHAEDFPGTGVGLAIVERIVRRHGGRVWAEGEVERGATFYFTLGRD